MVQREVADRFFAEPSTKAYGAVSVLVQLVDRANRASIRCRAPSSGRSRTSTRRSSPSGGPALPEAYSEGQARRRGRLRAPPQDAAELARAVGARLAGAGGRRAGCDRPTAGHSRRGARAARVRRPGRGAPMKRRTRRTAKINLALVVGPGRADGKHEVATVLQRIDLADGISLEAADADSRSPAFRTTRSCATRCWRWRGGGRRAALDGRDREADPGRRRPRRRELGRGGRASARERDASRAACGTSSSARDRGRDRRRRALLPGRRAAAGNRRRERAGPLELRERLPGRARPARRGREVVDGERCTRRSSARTDSPSAGPLFARRSRRATSQRCRRTTSPPLRSQTSSWSSARSAPDVTGAGPAVYGLFAEDERAEAARRALASRGRTWLAGPAWYG